MNDETKPHLSRNMNGDLLLIEGDKRSVVATSFSALWYAIIAFGEQQDSSHFAAPSGEAKSLKPLLDALRYRWLRDKAVWFDGEGEQMVWCVIGTGADDCHPCDGEELDQMIDAALGNRTPARQEAERECETCRGVGTIDERLGGEFFSNPAATCPDCDGKGWWVATPRKQMTQATGEDAITLAFRLYGEDPDTFAPETRAVMDKLRPIVAERLGMAASGEPESAAPLPVQGQDTALLNEYEQREMLGNPHALLLLMDWHDMQQEQADNMEAECYGDILRYEELRQLGAKVIASDPECWDDEIRRRFAEPTGHRAKELERARAALRASSAPTTKQENAE